MSDANGTGTVAGTAFTEVVTPITAHADATIERNGKQYPIYEPSDAPLQDEGGLSQSSKKHKRVAIVGRAPSSMMLAPFGNPDWEIWSLSNAAACGQINNDHWQAWFELHDLDEGQKRWPKEFVAWLQMDHGRPLYIQKPHPLVPHGIVYPWEKVFDTFGGYFNNSVAEMVAVALLEGATELALYGIDMAQSDPSLHNGNPEYQHQRPSCEFMLGWAMAKLGKDKVHIPAESDLLKCARPYAYPGVEGEHVRKCLARKKELQDRRMQCVLQEREARAQAHEWRVIAARHEGILQQAKHGGLPEGDLAKVQAEIDKALNQHRIHKYNAEEAMKGVAKLEGAIEDNDYQIQRMQA